MTLLEADLHSRNVRQFGHHLRATLSADHRPAGATYGFDQPFPKQPSAVPSPHSRFEARSARTRWDSNLRARLRRATASGHTAIYLQQRYHRRSHPPREPPRLTLFRVTRDVTAAITSKIDIALR
ncbi:hypothetical protein ACQPZF_10805 [Actinosynnema sp. CS-041913]|uniref:hypothetical protein n=1 Tax=Actinosynnema sp. CS-041913 TaxID=3239917 RepID=UPI003D8D08DE